MEFTASGARGRKNEENPIERELDLTYKNCFKEVTLITSGHLQWKPGSLLAQLLFGVQRNFDLRYIWTFEREILVGPI
ncbi:hypothetical protein EMCRGX_G016854 [Ephydatia muelleri]